MDQCNDRRLLPADLQTWSRNVSALTLLALEVSRLCHRSSVPVDSFLANSILEAEGILDLSRTGGFSDFFEGLDL